MEDLAGMSLQLVSQLQDNMNSLKDSIKRQGFRDFPDPLSLAFESKEENCPHFHYSPARQTSECATPLRHVGFEDSTLTSVFEKIALRRAPVTLRVLLEELRHNKALQDLVGLKFETRLIEAELEGLFPVDHSMELVLEDFQTFVNTVNDYVLHRNKYVSTSNRPKPNEKEALLEGMFVSWSEGEPLIEKSRLLALFQLNKQMLKNMLADSSLTIDDVNDRFIDSLQDEFNKVDFIRCFNYTPEVDHLEESAESYPQKETSFQAESITNPPKNSTKNLARNSDNMVSPVLPRKKTIPQPFKLSVSTGSSIRSRKLQEMLQKDEEEEMKEVYKKFKANPIPVEIYGTVEERQAQRMLRSQRAQEEALLELDEVISMPRPRKSASVKRITNDFHIPPPLISYPIKSKPKPDPEPELPFKAKDVPDFKKLQNKFKKQLDLKKQSTPRTVPTPFHLSNRSRSAQKHSLDVDGLLETFELTTKQKDLFRQTYQKLAKQEEAERKLRQRLEADKKKKFYVPKKPKKKAQNPEVQADQYEIFE